MPGGILVIGAGVAGMKASLLLAGAGRQVYLVESSSVIGGGVIRCEDVFPEMECATCMVSPMQQEVLRHDLIEVLTLSEVSGVEGSRGEFTVQVDVRASSVDTEACIGCAECWNACPVKVSNGFEENLSRRSAISVPCAGALPNVPWIDREACLRWTEGEDCTICSDACVFAAIDYSREDSSRKLEVTDIVLATGFRTSSEGFDGSYGLGSDPGVLTAPEFERRYASNGPTEGRLLRKDGAEPASVAMVVHAGGTGRHSALNTMYSLKFIHYLRERLPDIRPLVLLDSSYSPDRVRDPYHELWKASGAEISFHSGEPVSRADGKGTTIRWTGEDGDSSRNVDMLILGTRILPSPGTVEMSRLMGLGTDGSGFAAIDLPAFSSVSTSIPGVFAAGCAAGPMGISDAVTSAAAAAGRILSAASLRAV